MENNQYNVALEYFRSGDYEMAYQRLNECESTPQVEALKLECIKYLREQTLYLVKEYHRNDNKALVRRTLMNYIPNYGMDEAIRPYWEEVKIDLNGNNDSVGNRIFKRAIDWIMHSPKKAVIVLMLVIPFVAGFLASFVPVASSPLVVIANLSVFVMLYYLSVCGLKPTKGNSISIFYFLYLLGIFVPVFGSGSIDDPIAKMAFCDFMHILFYIPFYIYMYGQSNNVHVRKLMIWFIVMIFVPIVFLILSRELYDLNSDYGNRYDINFYFLLSQFLASAVNLYIIIMLYKNITKI